VLALKLLNELMLWANYVGLTAARAAAVPPSIAPVNPPPDTKAEASRKPPMGPVRNPFADTLLGDDRLSLPAAPPKH